MQLKTGERLVRIPCPKTGILNRTGVLDKDNRLVCYSKNIIGLNDNKPKWDWVKKDFTE